MSRCSRTFNNSIILHCLCGSQASQDLQFLNDYVCEINGVGAVALWMPGCKEFLFELVFDEFFKIIN